MANLIYKGLKANLPSTRNATSFYLCTDTRELYFGSDLYTEAVRFFTSTELVPKPANPAQGVLYVDETDGTGYAWNGTAWKTVVESADGIKAELIGENTDTASDDTIYGAKAYADDAVSDAKDELIGESTDASSADTIYGAKKKAEEEAAAVLGESTDASSATTVYGARALAAEKVASITAGGGIAVDTSSPNSSTAPSVGVKLSAKTGNELSIETGSGEEGLYHKSPVYTVGEAAEATSGYLKTYVLKKDGVAIDGSKIDIPKDYLVKSAVVSTVTAEDKASGGKFENDSNFAVGDKYIDFTINVKSGTATDEHIYLNVKDLAHVYTEGNGIDISASDVISIEIDSSNANGLSVGANGLALACATATNGNTPAAAGAMSGTDKDHLDAAYEAITVGSF